MVRATSLGVGIGVNKNLDVGSSITPLILDQLSVGPTVAYSLRKLKANYAGSAIRVRRSNDNAEADIGFNGTGDLDTAALISHVGANSGFITTWYDQSGNGIDAVQATTGAQPRIRNAGTTDTLGSLPTVLFNGSFDMTSEQFTGAFSQFSAVSVASMDTGVGNNAQLLIVLGNGDSNDFGVVTSLRFFERDGTNNRIRTYRNNATRATANLAGLDTPFVITGRFDTTDSRMYIDGTEGTSAAYAAAAVGDPVDLRIGRGHNTSTRWVGRCSELVFFTSALSTNDRQDLERDQGTYYGITVA